MDKRLLNHLIILSFALLTVSCSTGMVHKADIDYVDGAEALADNPARGAAPRGPWVVFQPEGLPDWHGESGFHSSLWELSRFSGGRMQDGKWPAPERVGEADIPLTDAMKADVRRFLDETRALGGTLIVRLGYTWTNEKGCEPQHFDLILEHIRDLSQIMAGYDDVIVGIEAGIVGPWGEMHSSDYAAPEYICPILKTYLDNLPATISLLVRAPRYFCMMTGKDAEDILQMLPFQDEYLSRLGMFNDGYIGTKEDYGTWTADFTREQGCRLLSAFHAHPYGGEMAFVDRQWLDEHAEIFHPEEWNLVQEMYRTHLSYLRNIHAKRHTIAQFLDNELFFDTLTYKFPDMPELSEYQGKSIGEFVLHHMGYRFVVRDLLAPKVLHRGKKATFRFTIENTGFGMLPLPTQAEMLFCSADEQKSVPVELPLCLKGGERQKIEVDILVPELPANDSCPVYLRIWAPTYGEAQPIPPTRLIRFANKGMWNDTLQANSLGQYRIK